MKPKTPKYPTIDEYYRLQLREVVSESYPQRRGNRAGAASQFAFRAETIDSVSDQARASTVTRH